MLLHLSFGVHGPFPSHTWIQLYSSPNGSYRALCSGCFNSCTLHPTNLFQTCGETARLWPAAHSSSFTSPFLIYRERKLENSFITCQGNSKHSEDSAKSPRQHSIRQKLQTELPSSPLYVTYLFTRFTVPLNSARPAVLLMLCKYLKLWSVRSGGSI